jgi:hypothetical protein
MEIAVQHFAGRDCPDLAVADFHRGRLVRSCYLDPPFEEALGRGSVLVQIANNCIFQLHEAIVGDRLESRQLQHFKELRVWLDCAFTSGLASTECGFELAKHFYPFELRFARLGPLLYVVYRLLVL